MAGDMVPRLLFSAHIQGSIDAYVISKLKLTVEANTRSNIRVAPTPIEA